MLIRTQSLPRLLLTSFLQRAQVRHFILQLRKRSAERLHLWLLIFSPFTELIKASIFGAFFIVGTPIDIRRARRAIGIRAATFFGHPTKSSRGVLSATRNSHAPDGVSPQGDSRPPTPPPHRCSQTTLSQATVRKSAQPYGATRRQSVSKRVTNQANAIRTGSSISSSCTISVPAAENGDSISVPVHISLATVGNFSDTEYLCP